MVNVTNIFGLLVVSYLIACLFHLHNLTLAGRMGLCLVFLFAALGHFFKTDSMISMLPPFVPARRAVIYVSGCLEILFAIAVVSLPNPSYVGWMILLYLIAIFPSNFTPQFTGFPSADIPWGRCTCSRDSRCNYSLFCGRTGSV
jgi:uncharacterized membrane protein